MPRDLFANIIAFNSTPSDMQLLGVSRNIDLGNGECIYNDSAPDPSHNKEVKTFFFDGDFREKLSSTLAAMAKQRGVAGAPALTFRYDDLPAFDIRLPKMHDANNASPICLGQAIAVAREPMQIDLDFYAGDNLLIVGGDRAVARRITASVPAGIFASHPDELAMVVFMNFLRPHRDSEQSLPSALYVTHTYSFNEVTDESMAVEMLGKINMVIEDRAKNAGVVDSHVFLLLMGVENCVAFNRGGRRGDEVSEAGKLLANILERGPRMGVYTIMQVEQLRTVDQLADYILRHFNHRIVLQMSEGDSRKAMGTDAASKLYDEQKPMSAYRALYYNARAERATKFRPYKI